ncbi:hypothetical protein CJ030_MR1G014121 [Morella rubra]|uniref:Uncharacterized protein n=1 Tax=Morella rubra TaxID=262757 RepID=A0A6A1WMM5_9ROSI|nr:hypothetical protein CJ030_MR1G014121 [Morella rubra]
MHLILCSANNPKKHTMELSYSEAKFMHLTSFPHEILLTQFLHVLLVPKGANEQRAVPLGSINKTTLSKAMAQTRRALHAAQDDIMPVGGKCLRCNSSICVDSTPDTQLVSSPSLRDREELPSPTIASPVGTQSSCASTSGIRHVKGSTHEIALLKARMGGDCWLLFTINILMISIKGIEFTKRTSSKTKTFLSKSQR